MFWLGVSGAVAAIGALTQKAFGAQGAEQVERFVEAHANEALRALTTPGLDAKTRRQTFASLMQQFADIPRIASFVIGRYAGALRADNRLAADWLRAFEAYAMASYASNLDRYSGAALRVTGSIERVPNQDVVVRSELNSTSGKPSTVQWRMVLSGGGWRVVDVAVVIDSNEVWLAQQQREQFLNILDRNAGDMRGLIAVVDTKTAQMERSSGAR